MKISRTLKVKHRMMVFVVISMAVFALIAIVNMVMTQKREKLYLQEETKKKLKNINAAISTNTDFMKSYAADYTCWDELVNLVYNFEPQWAQENLRSSLKTNTTDYVWIFNKQMKPVYACNSEDVEPIAYPLLPYQVYSMLDTISLSRRRICSFFIKHDKKIIQVCGATIHISKDQKRLMTAHGFYFFGHVIDTVYLKKLEVLTGAAVTVSTDPSLSTKTKVKGERMVLKANLPTWNQEAVGQLIFTISDSFRENEKEINTIYYFFIVILIVSLAVAYYILVATRISRSLSRIVSSLDRADSKPIEQLLDSQDEFGKIAQMIDAAFQQKKKLEDEIEQRTKVENEIMLQKEELLSQSEELHVTAEELSIQVEKLQSQNHMIMKQSSNILESMTYASRIQNALLPSENSLKTNFSDYFILYRPRDIVSGDFYYVKNSNYRVIIAAADCTGHGVPGAFLSMLGLSFLNEIVLHQSNISPNQILEELRTYTVSSLSSSSTMHEMQVGMDISVCVIDYENKRLDFSGAHSPVYIVRQNHDAETHDLIELKADNISISQSRKWKSFSLKSLDLETGDMVYLFSDGILHQFGGPQDRKYGSQRLKAQLVQKSFNDLPLCEQGEVLEKNFDAWRGNNIQIDDVMILGFKLEKPQNEEGILYEDSFMGLFEMDEEEN